MGQFLRAGPSAVLTLPAELSSLTLHCLRSKRVSRGAEWRKPV